MTDLGLPRAAELPDAHWMCRAPIDLLVPHIKIKRALITFLKLDGAVCSWYERPSTDSGHPAHTEYSETAFTECEAAWGEAEASFLPAQAVFGAVNNRVCSVGQYHASCWHEIPLMAIEESLSTLYDFVAYIDEPDEARELIEGFVKSDVLRGPPGEDDFGVAMEQELFRAWTRFYPRGSKYETLLDMAEEDRQRIAAPLRPGNRPAYERDRLFLKWYEGEGEDTYHSHAKIRDRWNAMPVEDRRNIARKDYGRVKRGVVITAVKKAKGEREDVGS